MQVVEDKALGLLQAIKWIITSFGISNVIFEIVSKQVVDDVLNTKLNHTEYLSLMHMIVDLC